MAPPISLIAYLDRMAKLSLRSIFKLSSKNKGTRSAPADPAPVKPAAAPVAAPTPAPAEPKPEPAIKESKPAADPVADEIAKEFTEKAVSAALKTVESEKVTSPPELVKPASVYNATQPRSGLLPALLLLALLAFVVYVGLEAQSRMELQAAEAAAALAKVAKKCKGFGKKC